MRHLITGGQQGSGLGLAKALAGAGYHVAFASRPYPPSAIELVIRASGAVA